MIHTVDAPQRFYGLEVRTRMTVVDLDGSLLLQSPLNVDKRRGERRRSSGGRQLKSLPLIAPAHHSIAQITRMAPHARRTCARIASVESESGTRVRSRGVKSDLLPFSEVSPSTPFGVIANESRDPRCFKDGSSPTADISNALQLQGLRGRIGSRVPTSVQASSKLVRGAPPETARPRLSKIPLRSSSSYAAITISIGTPNSTGQRCA
jgi:hypothetical protein